MILDPILDLFRGEAVTIPPMDGAFRPNTRLEDAPLLSTLPEPDNLVLFGGRVVATSGAAIYALDPSGMASPLQTLSSPVTALAAALSGQLAIGLEEGRLLFGDQEQRLPAEIGCITALAFDADGGLWLANGSSRHKPSDWAADLMTHGASGSVWHRQPGADAFRRVADGLAFPYGLLPEAGGVLVSESWRHRLVRFDRTSGAKSIIVDHLPGYPARLSTAAGGGAWLSVFAPRNRLVEFVLQEKHYRQDMMATVSPDHWIAPAMSSRRSFLEPLQCGGIRTMGVHKPWSPSRSYGMVVRLNSKLSPVYSVHSRADGSRHGTCSAIEHDGRLIVASKGGDCLVSVDMTGQEGI